MKYQPLTLPRKSCGPTRRPLELEAPFTSGSEKSGRGAVGSGAGPVVIMGLQAAKSATARGFKVERTGHETTTADQGPFQQTPPSPSIPNDQELGSAPVVRKALPDPRLRAWRHSGPE